MSVKEKYQPPVKHTDYTLLGLQVLFHHGKACQANTIRYRCLLVDLSFKLSS